MSRKPLIGPEFSEWVEYLFNYAWDDFSLWGRDKFFGTPARGVLSFYAVFAVAVGVALILAPSKKGGDE